MASPTQAKQAECYISWGDDVAEGPCEMGQNSTGTHFTLDVDDGLHLTVLVYRAPSVGVVSPPRGMMAKVTMWADSTDKQVVDDLGSVTPLDACWINDRVRICAWPMTSAERNSPPSDQ